jgi:AraC-like DNA-binding protein
MDPLSDVLRAVRLNGAYFYEVRASLPWNVEAVAARTLSPPVLPDSEHLISYHMVVDGTCYGMLVGGEPIPLEPGDVILFPHGDPHVMCSHPDGRGAVEYQRSAPAKYPFRVHMGDGPSATELFCGFLGCDRTPFNPLLAALPRALRVERVANPGFGLLIRQVTAEAQIGGWGASSVLTRLAELMFIEVIRRYISQLPAEETGWLAALRDDVVGRALGLVHSRYDHAWTVEELAHAVGASRSNFVARFTALVGQPPMQYLTQWRMQVAARMLRDEETKVSGVGAAVGYDSEAAFSRAFKKTTGVSPGAWRARRRAGVDAGAGSSDDQSLVAAGNG